VSKLPPILSIDDLATIFATRGLARYGGETVTQTDHALQCALLAEQAGERPETIVAALLHDFGHLVGGESLEKGATVQDEDDRHQFIGLPYLRQLFGDAVLAPIRLHVDAKRFLCTTEGDYWSGLSPASKLSLELQGGPFSPAEADAFTKQNYAQEAIRLRRYDDLAKVSARTTPTFFHFTKIIRTL
jgi:phosphonate degradation associated HDIG domain protein